MFRFITAFIFASFATLAVGAPNYIQLKPLDSLVGTSTGSVKSGTNILPVITWGGDIATIYANGSQGKTAKGSIFSKHGLNYRLVREDDFTNQLKNYISGNTPFLRGTMGMVQAASDLLSKDSNLKPVVFYQMTWSAGGDALVVKPNIRTAKDLKGKTVALQAYGPHVDYFAKVLDDAGLSFSDVKVKWLPDLTGTDNSPMAALYESDIDAVFVIIPDALALTSGGNVGTGAEDSVKGARILMSTKTANRVIADVYAVRSDYYKKHQGEIRSLTQALMEGADKTKQVVSARNNSQPEYRKLMSSAAEILLDSPDAIADTEGLYADCEFVYLAGNNSFFADQNYPRRFSKILGEINQSLGQLNLISKSNLIGSASFNYKTFNAMSSSVPEVSKPKFNKEQLSALVSRKQQQGALSEGELFSFEVFFGPNQNSFPVDLYQSEFSKVVDLAATYGGAVITVEGHSDPMGYLRAKKGNKPPVVLGRIKQSAKNLSVSRAQSVRDSIIEYANSNSISLDISQFEPIGHGITSPATGICGSDPCPPKTEAEWRSNMRVVFRIIQIEAESDVFMPL